MKTPLIQRKIIFKYGRRLLFIGMIVALSAATSPAMQFASGGDSLIVESESAPEMDELLSWHEVFTYEVRYSFFRLGEVKVEVVSDTLYRDQEAWYIRTIITSNPGIPFVGREENHYNSIFTMTDSLPHELAYWTDDLDDNEFENSRYEYDYVAGKVYARDDEERDTLDIEEPASSGQLIFLISRLFAGSENDFTIPVYLNLEKGYIEVTNTLHTEMREYKAFEKPVKTYYSEGESTIDGPFGFRGSFKSWYLADDLRVPLEAHLRVWLGNVRIKLIEYTKESRS